jgi:sec-independent protein translocase protein TatB
MFGMGMPEIILILAIALIVLGPKKLPEIAKSLGRGIAEFKKATQDFKQSINTDNDFKQTKQTLHEMKSDLHSAVRETIKPDATAGAKPTVDEDDDEDDEDDDQDLSLEKNKATVSKDSTESTTSADQTHTDYPAKEDKEKGPSNNA